MIELNNLKFKAEFDLPEDTKKLLNDLNENIKQLLKEKTAVKESKISTKNNLNKKFDLYQGNKKAGEYMSHYLF